VSAPTKPPRQGFWPPYAPVVTWTFAIAYVAIGAGLLFQPSRFSNTPSYANLLIFTSAGIWGCAYLAVAALMIGWRVAVRFRWLGVLAHVTAIALTSWWLVAFIVRYLTDNGTTVVNVVSWSVFLSLVIRSMSGLDDEEER
jgi:hypothetical protein